jgi:predicted ATPase
MTAMRLHRLEIHNYKSLRNVVIEPTPLSVFVGPNAAGKTNLADAIDFLGHAYAWGLEKAVAYKGGYENICFRDVARSKDPIRFRLVVEIPDSIWKMGGVLDIGPLLFDHSFEIRTPSRGIQAPYIIGFEEIVIDGLAESGTVDQPLRVTRKNQGVKVSRLERESPIEITREDLQSHLERNLQKSAFLLPLLERFGLETGFESEMGLLRVFQLDPRSCREAGIPTPNPDLDRTGRNLPVALDHLKKDFPEEYSEVLEMTRRVMPTLEGIETDWTHTRSLALFLKERGVRRPWTSEDVSVGTLQTIALLVAAFDPRPPLVVIEEPENSVHPWALRNLVEAFRLASEKKQILLTTHSPILIDQLKPEEVWVVRKPGTETKIDPLLSLDPSLKESWGQGKFTLSEYLDSGAVPEAVPAAS